MTEQGAHSVFVQWLTARKSSTGPDGIWQGMLYTEAMLFYVYFWREEGKVNFFTLYPIFRCCGLILKPEHSCDQCRHLKRERFFHLAVESEDELNGALASWLEKQLTTTGFNEFQATLEAAAMAPAMGELSLPEADAVARDFAHPKELDRELKRLASEFYGKRFGGESWIS